MVEKIQSKSHPSHYLVHKYWGRKAHNLVAAYLEHYSKKGDVVLDPFMGSGGVVIESKRLGRTGVGVDINPITKLIVENTLADIDIDALLATHSKLIESIPAELINLATTKCPTCDKKSKLLNAAWDGESIVRVKGRCETDGIFVQDAAEDDLKLAKQGAKLLKKYSAEKDFYYPKDKIFQFVRRNGKSHIHHLFSDRNLLIAAYLLREIRKISDPLIRDQFLMAFTSMLPNISSMIPVDMQNVTGKSGWQISKFWVPKQHTEKNVIDSFNSRLKVIEKAKRETANIFSSVDHQAVIASAEDLHFLKNDSIDYIFTDPPYGDSIAYLGLSMFWNSWLKYDVDYEAEIIYDTYRSKDAIDYSRRLVNAFSEAYRVLKPGKFMSFTFHNRHVKFWKIVIGAVLDNGFEMKTVVWQPQAVSSGTQGINRKNTLKGDFVYTFQKPIKASVKHGLPDTEGESKVLMLMERILNEQEHVETPHFYEQLIPVLVKDRAFLDKSGKILNIDGVLKKNFEYANIDADDEDRYGWKKF